MDGQLTIGAKPYSTKQNFMHTQRSQSKRIWYAPSMNLENGLKRIIWRVTTRATRWRDLVIELPPPDEKVL